MSVWLLTWLQNRASHSDSVVARHNRWESGACWERSEAPRSNTRSNSCGCEAAGAPGVKQQGPQIRDCGLERAKSGEWMCAMSYQAKQLVSYCVLLINKIENMAARNEGRVTWMQSHERK